MLNDCQTTDSRSNDPFLLPVFDVAKIEQYFSNDYGAIREVFGLVHEDLPNDLAALHSAFAAKDIVAMRRTLHTIKPIFNFIGLPAVETALNDFHILCKECASAAELEQPFSHLWPQLLAAMEMIAAQHRLFGQMASDPPMMGNNIANIG
jgi:HPt (histidine-containing phosphotransfer) domain-containing protein